MDKRPLCKRQEVRVGCFVNGKDGWFKRPNEAARGSDLSIITETV